MTATEKILFAGAVIWLLSAKRGRAATTPTAPAGVLPRGIRNNNPGNIRITNNQWRGKIPIERNTDGAFEQFESMDFGVRAAILNLRSYFDRGLNTVEKIVNTWAPPSENNTSGYMGFVESCAGINRKKVLSFTPVQVAPILRCMFVMENGSQFENLLPTTRDITRVWENI